MGDVSIEIGGRLLTGWSGIRVSSSLGAAAATLSITGAQLPARTLNGTSRLFVRFGKRPVFGGYLDEVATTRTDGGLEVTATGRSFTADLVDSQIPRVEAFGEVTGETISQIIARYFRSLRALVGIRSNEVDPKPVVARHAPNPGETYWSAIERACRSAGVLATAARDGKLRLLDPKRMRRAPIALREGENLLSLRASTNWSRRARTVVAEGQGDGLGDSWESDIGLEARATDESIRRGRVSVVQVDGAATAQDVEARAQWEAAVRAARGSSYTVVVPDWAIPGTDETWQLGTLVGLSAPSMLFSGSLVIDSIEHRLNDSGRVTQLGLVRRGAYQSQPVVAAADEPTRALSGAGGDW